MPVPVVVNVDVFPTVIVVAVLVPPVKEENAADPAALGPMANHVFALHPYISPLVVSVATAPFWHEPDGTPANVRPTATPPPTVD